MQSLQIIILSTIFDSINNIPSDVIGPNSKRNSNIYYFLIFKISSTSIEHCEHTSLAKKVRISERLWLSQKGEQACKGKLPRIFIDDGAWYPLALERVEFKRHTIVYFGPISAIKRFFGYIEWRVRRFWNGFNGKYTRKSMERCI